METNVPALITAAFLLLVLGAVLWYAARVAEPLPEAPPGPPPGAPMPTWGQIDGGSLLDEQINELTLMILNGDRAVRYEGKVATPWEHTADVVNNNVAQGLAQPPKQPDVQQLPFYQALNPQE